MAGQQLATQQIERLANQLVEVEHLHLHLVAPVQRPQAANDLRRPGVVGHDVVANRAQLDEIDRSLASIFRAASALPRIAASGWLSWCAMEAESCPSMDTRVMCRSAVRSSAARSSVSLRSVMSIATPSSSGRRPSPCVRVPRSSDVAVGWHPILDVELFAGREAFLTASSSRRDPPGGSWRGRSRMRSPFSGGLAADERRSCPEPGRGRRPRPRREPAALAARFIRFWLSSSAVAIRWRDRRWIRSAAISPACNSRMAMPWKSRADIGPSGRLAVPHDGIGGQRRSSMPQRRSAANRPPALGERRRGDCRGCSAVQAAARRSPRLASPGLRRAPRSHRQRRRRERFPAPHRRDGGRRRDDLNRSARSTHLTCAIDEEARREDDRFLRQLTQAAPHLVRGQTRCTRCDPGLRFARRTRVCAAPRSGPARSHRRRSRADWRRDEVQRQLERRRRIEIDRLAHEVRRERQAFQRRGTAIWTIGTPGSIWSRKRGTNEAPQAPKR